MVKNSMLILFRRISVACLMLGTAFLGYSLHMACIHGFSVAFEGINMLHRIIVKLYPLDDCS